MSAMNSDTLNRLNGLVFGENFDPLTHMSEAEKAEALAGLKTHVGDQAFDALDQIRELAISPALKTFVTLEMANAALADRWTDAKELGEVVEAQTAVREATDSLNAVTRVLLQYTGLFDLSRTPSPSLAGRNQRALRHREPAMSGRRSMAEPGT